MKYLGETIVDVNDTPFAGYGISDWVLYYVMNYGQFDGGHHKQWVLDQISRIIHCTPIIVKLARWDDGTEEYRVDLCEPSNAYNEWVKKMRGEWNDNDGYEFSYDEGVAP